MAKTLTTTSSKVILTASLTTPDQVNYLSPQTCPPLTADEFDLIKEGGNFSMESTRKNGVVYTFQVMPLTKASASARFKEFFNTKDIQLVNLQGIMKIEQPFEHACEYTYKTGSTPVKSIVRGVQDTRVATAR